MEKIYEISIERECPYGKNILDDLDILKSQSKESIKDYNDKLITEAYYFCVEAHKIKNRASGIPYYTHPLKVALSLMKEFSFSDNVTIAASLLHDTVEDNDEITLEIITEKFGHEIASIVDGVTKIKDAKDIVQNMAATYEKLFSGLVHDIRVIIIKLADRLDNLRTLHYLKPEKQQSVADETLNFYIPFAQRLGLIKIKRELEDLSLYFKDRKAYETIRPALAEKRMEFLKYIQLFTNQLTDKLNEKSIEFVLTIEHKHVYEIFKMIEQGKPLSEIDNFYSMVITLNTNDYSECYRTYGIIANVFGLVSTLDDYIARPKINFYRALHSTHFGPARKLVEVIIRTQEMDKIADGGISGLYSIQDVNRSLELSPESTSDWVQWMKNIIDDQDPEAIQKIWGSIRMNLYEDEITVHSTEGDSIRLPNGACPVDFAFAISDEIGMHCISAKVNGDLKSLEYELKNNDQVEIITSTNSIPSAEWQDFIVTQKAIVFLYNYFKHKKEQIIEQNKIEHSKMMIARLRIVGEDRPSMLHDITKIIGKVNIIRINLHTSDTVFEGALTLHIEDESHLNILFTKLLEVKGIKGIERLDSFD